MLRGIARAALVILLFGGCKGSGESSPQERSSSAAKSFVLKHEATFNPVRYDFDASHPTTAAPSGSLDIRPIAMTVSPETTSGFRVQVLFTQDIDQATRLRDSLDSILPDQWIYVVYDAPYYKIRVGNQEDRTSASQLVRRLASFGYKDAWIVPDNILLNIPQKPPDMEIEAIPRLQADR